MDIPNDRVVGSYGTSKGLMTSSQRMGTEGIMDTKKSDVLQGTLDLMILKTLHALGPLHGFGIARRIEQVSRDVLQLNEGTVYTSLLRLQQQGWIAAAWGTSENNRRGEVLLHHRRADGSSSRSKRRTGSASPA